MNIGDNDFVNDPGGDMPGERRYVVSESHPNQVYQQEVGGTHGDLLVL